MTPGKATVKTSAVNAAHATTTVVARRPPKKQVTTRPSNNSRSTKLPNRIRLLKTKPVLGTPAPANNAHRANVAAETDTVATGVSAAHAMEHRRKPETTPRPRPQRLPQTCLPMTTAKLSAKRHLCAAATSPCPSKPRQLLPPLRLPWRRLLRSPPLQKRPPR